MNNIRRIIEAVRGELIGRYPAIDRAILYPALLPGDDAMNCLFAADGSAIYYSERIAEVYRSGPAVVKRAFLHTILHCLFLHVVPPSGADKREWDAYADREIEKVMELLRDPMMSVSEEELKLTRDDHSHWYGSQHPEPEVVENWKRLYQEARGSGFGSASDGGAGSTPGSGEEELIAYNGRLYKYHQYLRRFMTQGEEQELDHESFDQIYYDLGMKLYDGMPLIEPLEQREVYRLEDLVIAIDTSGSCSQELVSRFFKETDSILTERGNFFSHMNVLILQCDCWIEHRAEIRSKEEWRSYLENVRIFGRGGTDYKPIFREIMLRRQDGRMKKPAALICFTDGDGSYPENPPDYEVVFVLAGDKKKCEAVPEWIRILEL